MKLIDLTHTLTQSVPVYPGDSQPALHQIASIEQDGFTNYELTTSMHVGTHIEAPAHMIRNGKKLSDIPIATFCGPGKIIDARNAQTITHDLLNQTTIAKNDILLIMTGHDKHFHNQNYYTSYPVVSEQCAEQIVERGVKIVGLDTPSPDHKPFKIHKLLFENDVVIIENLTNLQSLINIKNFRIIALPTKLETDAAPARVVADVQ